MLGLRSHRLTLVLQPSRWVALVLLGTREPSLGADRLALVRLWSHRLTLVLQTQWVARLGTRELSWGADRLA